MRAFAETVCRAIPGATLLGDPEAVATHVDALHVATPASLSWLRKGSPIPDGWSGAILLCWKGTIGRVTEGQALVLCRNPRLGLGYALRHFCLAEAQVPRIRIDPSAYVSGSAAIGVEGNSVEWEDELGEWFRIPAIAGVVIGPDVRIGAFTSIVRGVLEDTRIGADAEICNHVNIGHGAQIGAHAVIAPFAAIGGSAVLGEKVTVWQNAAIRNGVTIGDGAVIGQAANVLTDVPAGETWAGNPARRLR